jgi:tRNA (guanine37-N1)-methyltransferase
MQIVVCTIFPALFENFFSESLIGKAVDSGHLEFKVLNIRDFTRDKHLKVDDVTYGGGAGMVMTPAPLDATISKAHELFGNGHVVYLSPQGRVFNQKVAKELHDLNKPLVFVCGRYEGIDERVIKNYVDEEISIGDFVLNGGEIASMVIIETVFRLIPGVLGNSQSLDEESHASGLLEYPHYTRPQIYKGEEVPPILLSGHHAKIQQWRHLQSLKRTREKRLDLFEKYDLSKQEKLLLKGIDN